MRMVRGTRPERTYDAIRDEILAKHAATVAPVLQHMPQHQEGSRSH
jgi:hypothetical protein